MFTVNKRGTRQEHQPMTVQSNGRATRERGVSVYLMAAGGVTKIGLSLNPSRRASYLRVGCPEAITIHAEMRLPDRETATEVERAAHRVLGWCRSHGEWFFIDPRYAEGVVRHLVAGCRPKAERLARHLRRLAAIDELRVATASPGPFQRVDYSRHDRVGRLWLRAYRMALGLGVPRSEWDDVLPL